ncbi:MAG: ATP-dependent zinc protease [Microscillaceae bacterium]|nr:ATP-dependent zinc protease [Microscillaceae bacterium]
MSTSPKIIIGSLDKVDFPEFSLFNLPCKIDTGAQTSAIHCHRVRLIEKDGVEIIAFKLLDPKHPEYNDQEYRTHDFEERSIKSSNGHTEFRYVIRSPLILFNQTIETEFTLADRERMKYPVLLGRRLLKDRFMVDVSKKNVSYQQKISNAS